MLTERAYFLLLVLPALLIGSLVLPALGILAFLYGVSLVFLIVLDWRQAGPLSQFQLRREHDDKLSLGVPNLVRIYVEARAVRSVGVEVRDEPPLLFQRVEQTPLTGHANVREALTLTYHVRPVTRGNFNFGDLNIRWDSPLQLVRRQGVISAAAPVKVYPNLHEIQKFDLLAKRDHLAGMGLHNVRWRGEGTAFESLREYTPDDSYRSINWKATARQRKPISTDYEPERSQRVMIMVDIGRMMRSPIRVQEEDGLVWNMAKVDFVLNSVLLFSYVATLKGDQVGLLVFGDRVEHYLSPGAGRGQFHHLLETLYALQSQPVEPDYGRALRTLAAQNRKRSLVVMFTDLSGARAAESLLRELPRLRSRHLPLLVTIRDPALGEEASTPLTDSGAVYRRAVAEQIIEERQQVFDLLRHQGVLSLDVSAEHLSMSVVNQYLMLKSRSLL